MPVRIREADYETTSGTTYPVAPDAVRGHLMIFASGGSMEELPPSFGDSPDPVDAAFSIVAYDPDPAPGTATPSDRVKSRLKALVEGSRNYVIVGVTGDTIWSDGTTVEAQPAFALGSTVFYDTTNCRGDGRWIRGVNDAEECTSSVGMLYHELAHAFHGHGLGDVATEEAEAIDDENDLRAAQGLVLRDRDRIEGGCGCPDGGCCIVASVALGTPFAHELQQLRRVRDHALRASEIGRGFFDALHREYYAFSIDICRVMVRSEAARERVAESLVRPLVEVLGVFSACAEHGDDPGAVGRAFRLRAVNGPGALPLHEAQAFLAQLAGGALPRGIARRLDPATAEILELLARWLPRSPHVLWGIVRPVRLWLTLRGRAVEAGDAERLGKWILREYEAWIGDVPLPDGLAEGPSAATTGHVRTFVRSVARDAGMRARLTARLEARLRATRGEGP